MHSRPKQGFSSTEAPKAGVAYDMEDPVLSALLHSSRDCIKLLSLSGNILYINPTGLQVRQIPTQADVIGRPLWEIWPEEAHEIVREAIKKAAAGGTRDFRGFCPTSRGRPKWWDVRTVPVCDHRGEVAAVLVVSKDVTDAVTSRKMYDTIALEMRHRLKNAFAVASAIAKISSRKHPEYQGFVEELVGRFSSLAVAQAKLVDTASDFPLRSLVSDIVDAAGISDETINVSDLPDCRVDESQMRVIAVVIGELTTNSLKYGALRSGVPVQCSGRLEEDWLHLSWSEPVAGVIDTQSEDGSSTSTGLMVIQRIVMSAGGQVTRRIENGVLRVDFSLVRQGMEDSSE